MDGKKMELIEIVGKEYVSESSKLLEAYARDQSFALPIRPWYITKPSSVNEVQAIIEWANQTGTPLVPVSSGPPHFYGDTVPSVPGAVIVDLCRMNQIISIDRRNRITIIEPGVTYSQLQPALAGQGLRLSTPPLPRANKSVIASLLERQPTLIPKNHWSLPEPLRSLEIVWGNGEIIGTGGAGAHPLHSLKEQKEKESVQIETTVVGSDDWNRGQKQIMPVETMGPGTTDWHRLVSAAQGSMGIITWASIKCELLPKVHRLLFIPAKNLDDLIECAYELLSLK